MPKTPSKPRVHQNPPIEVEPKPLARCENGHIRCKGGCEPSPGRPTDWRTEYNRQIIDFFDIKERFSVHYDGGDKPHLIASAPPLFEDFAHSIGVNGDTLVEWADPANEAKYPGFSAAYARAKEIQKNYLITCGVVNAGNSSFIQFMLKNNHGMREKTEQELSGPGGTSLKINVTTYGPGDFLSTQLDPGAPPAPRPDEPIEVQIDRLASKGTQDDAGGK